MESPDQIWHLIARALNGEASHAEQEELMKLLRHDESLQQQYDLLTRIWKEKDAHIESGDNDAARRTISRIIDKAGSDNKDMAPVVQVKWLNQKRIWLAASSIVVIFLAAWLLKSYRQPSAKADTNKETLEARNGSRSRSLLRDGTTVWLNAGSKLYYENDFTGRTREVRLEGEVFFDVVKHAEQPFIVHTSGIDIKVLGTAFNVKSYPEDKTVETTLYRGSVQVFREEDPQQTTIQLKPNEKLILAKQAANKPSTLSDEGKPTIVKEAAASFTITHIDSTKKENERVETAWIYSRLEFHGDSFEELARKMERWYNVKINFSDEKVMQLSFNGTFETETLDQAFKYLKEVNSFIYEINDHDITVSSSE